MRVLALALVVASAALILSACGSTSKLSRAEAGAGAARAMQFREIHAAKASNPLLSIFPGQPGKRACLIPSGGITSRKLHGSCETTVRWAENRHEPLQIVTFTERWKGPPCPPGGTCSSPYYSWVFWVAPSMSNTFRPVVVARHTRGAFPPQAND